MTVSAAPEDETIKNDSVTLLVPLFKLLSDEDDDSSGGGGGEEEDDSIVSKKNNQFFSSHLIGLGHTKVKSTNQSNPSIQKLKTFFLHKFR